MLWLCMLLILGQGTIPEDAVEQWGRPTLWLASLYALMFGSETWLRMRGRMPQQ